MANIVQRTQYYPFGLPFADAQARDLQPYTYNGKENDSRLQLNLMDYEARLYNPQYGSIPTMDPLLEKYYSWSPYAYVGNNPLRRVDPNGKDWKDKVMGGIVGTLTNIVPGSTGARDLYSPNDASDYNNALQAVDVASAVTGAVMVVVGSGEMGAGGGMAVAGATVAATGAGAVVGGGTAAVGGAIAAKGAFDVLVGGLLVGNSSAHLSLSMITEQVTQKTVLFMGIQNQVQKPNIIMM